MPPKIEDRSEGYLCTHSVEIEDWQGLFYVRWTPIVGQFPGKNKVVDVLRLFVVLFLPFEII